ncbi:HAD-IIB family hydrolase [Acidovorax sp. DW039]|uniref:HAD-IIB family hydrolase n=1 Tax=Acidovorax sp. DW039 TaxID=3095606 RepID=UPI003084D341|nr:HAD-IIB family hydrolase [Acidovorax sp. DW039]
MKHFAQCEPSGWHNLTGLFTDIDDTLTTDGAITPDALKALADLKAAGLSVVAITGRPVGWSEPFALQWPVDAIVAENGAVALRRAEGLNEITSQRLLNKRWQLSKSYQQAPAVRQRNFARMQEVLAQIEAEVPGAQRATDSAGRETDIAIDHSEFTHLPQEAIDHAVRIMREAGMNATVSSIHINGWFGDHNKLEGARWIVRELWGRDLDAEMGRWVYVGDSTNDQLMFQHFEHSVGVANVARFVPQLQHLPRYVTEGERGAGFAEVARAVLANRQSVHVMPDEETAHLISNKL